MARIPTSVKNKKLVEKRREQITLAAMKLFAVKGLHKTTLRDLAEEVGISHGNIYDYVGNKEDIVVLIHNYVTSEILEVLDACAAKFDDPLERLRQMVIGEFNASYVWRQATLIVYQEGKAISKDRLKQLLRSDRNRLKRFETTMEECIQKGKCKNVNTRLVSNLIKIMADIWPLKSWDLSGHTSKFQIEKTILDALFKGILQVESQASSTSAGKGSDLSGQSILLINSGNYLGEALCTSFLSAGANVASYQQGTQDICKAGFDALKKVYPDTLYIFRQFDCGEMDASLLGRIINETGGIGSVIYNWDYSQNSVYQRRLDLTMIDKSFQDARYLVAELKQSFNGQKGRIIHIAPSYWIRNEDPILYESIKASVMALVKQLSKDRDFSTVNINGVIPGYIDGISTLQKGDEADQGGIGDIPLQSVGDLDDIIESIHFLLSGSSKYITGQILSIDGGFE